MRVKNFFPVILFILTVLFSGCAHLSPKPSIDYSHRPEACSRFFEALTDTVNETGVPDAGTVPIPGFPYLRTNRFLSALAEKVTDENRFADWLVLMQQQAAGGFEKEIQNLPTPDVEKLAADIGVAPNRSALLQKVSFCASTLSAQDETHPDFRKALLAATHTPDEYSQTMRILGLYPLASLPVTYLTHRAQEKFKGWFETPMENLPVQGQLIAYKPEEPNGSPKEIVRKLFETTQGNSLHMKVFNSDHVRRLAEALAPTIVQDVSGPHDVPGMVTWKEDQVQIDAATPTLYYYLSYAMVEKEPIVQINYAAWFSARKGPLAPSIERGPLDGLTFRISLNAEGDPFMLDIMNNCGCYHMFIPRKEAVVATKTKALAIDAFIPQWLPNDFPVLPLHVRANSGWHQVQRAWTSKEPLSSTSVYGLIPYQELESLPRPDGQQESVFNARGIMKGSNRIEPFLLFSMGVPSVGSMRQRGHHAISLVGRDHFDAPDLFEKNFVFKQSVPE